MKKKILRPNCWGILINFFSLKYFTLYAVSVNGALPLPPCIYIEASRGTGTQSVTVRPTGCGFDPPLEEMKYFLKFIFYFVALQHAMPPEFGRKWGMKCLNTRFPLPTQLLKLIYFYDFYLYIYYMYRLLWCNNNRSKCTVKLCH